MPKDYKRSSRSRSHRDRLVNTRQVVQRFLIVCEGEKTEPNYFRNFRVPKVVCTVKGFGRSTENLIKETIKERDKDKYDQVWCVFDRDDCSVDSFNKALALAKQHNIQVAYSNQAFELWYLLHFHYYNTAVTRADYITKLDGLLKRKYEKNSETIYQELQGRQEEAIKNAKRLLDLYNPPNPVADDPSTTVHLLVEELNRFAR